MPWLICARIQCKRSWAINVRECSIKNLGDQHAKVQYQSNLGDQCARIDVSDSSDVIQGVEAIEGVEDIFAFVTCRLSDRPSDGIRLLIGLTFLFRVEIGMNPIAIRWLRAIRLPTSFQKVVPQSSFGILGSFLSPWG